jgi:membrane protease YdiL (CAAX protease family)
LGDALISYLGAGDTIQGKLSGSLGVALDLEAAIAGASIVILAPIVEEIVFRGLLYASARAVMGPAAAAVLSSAAFGLYHHEVGVGLLSKVWIGLVLAWLFERSQNLGPPIVGHAMWNLYCLVGRVDWPS